MHNFIALQLVDSDQYVWINHHLIQSILPLSEGVVRVELANNEHHLVQGYVNDIFERIDALYDDRPQE